MPDPTELLDVGTVFGTAKNAYVQMLDNEDVALDIRTRADAIISQATETAAKLTDRTEADALIARAQAMLPVMDAILLELQAERLLALMRTVNSIGSTIPRLAATRQRVTMVDPSDWDARFQGLKLRYEMVYRPLFPIGEGGVIAVPDPAEMTAQDWDLIRTHAEGPIYLWNIAECEQNWVVGGIPPCQGPDYLAVLSMINQVMEMWQVEILQWKEFPMVTFYDAVLGGAIRRSAEHLGNIEKMLNEMGRILKDLSELAYNVTKAAADVVSAVAKTPGWLLLALAAGAYVLLKNKKKEG